jgi:hypothetical protein
MTRRVLKVAFLTPGTDSRTWNRTFGLSNVPTRARGGVSVAG